ncbi:XRE family transcriptional regulator [Actinomadura craniellae]|uniref:XRE family transcriptional regulator n=1 Tax=Actinomadura craniellae TaxID=2231787 RepID=A0A365HA29_9ACTN|nr:helix-turn-helix transcriptional regulator [Actinomadura craniellae]RAY15941.1 XRE family transcriptional regulator [Actinomadura craniellae]
MGRRPKELDPTASAAALLGAKVRRFREERGWSQEELGTKVFCTGDMISKIELARRMPAWDTTVAFDRVFGTGEYFQELWKLAKNEILPTWFRPYADLEPEANSICIFSLTLVHGLLQTEAYATEVLRSNQEPDRLEQLVDVRMKRQEILNREDPPMLWVVLDEMLLHRQIGTGEVMKDQLRHLIELSQRPNVTIQVVPADRGSYPGLAGPLTILGFKEDPDAAYAEAHGGGQLIEEDSAVEYLQIRFDRIRASALSQEESLELLRKILES